MKTQIEKLIELAKDYVIFGIEIGLPNAHNHIRGGNDMPDYGKEGDLINIYFDRGGDTWQVEFKKVKIIGYSKQIEMPFDADIEYLESVYKSAKEYLYDYLLPSVAKCKIATMKQRHQEIKELEGKIRKLKGLV